MVFLIFLTISQAPIFAKVKPLDFSKKSQMLHVASSKGSIDLRKCSSKKINLHTITFKNTVFNNNIELELIGKRAPIKDSIDLNSDCSLGLINKYQFRRDLNKKSGMLIARVGHS